MSMQDALLIVYWGNLMRTKFGLLTQAEENLMSTALQRLETEHSPKAVSSAVVTK